MARRPPGRRQPSLRLRGAGDEEAKEVKEDALAKPAADDEEPKEPDSFCTYFGKCLHAIFLQRPFLSLLHVFYPLALYFQFTVRENDDVGNALLFTFALLSIVPQAERLGYVTEQLAMHVGETTAGLLNVTFGNLPELIVTIVAILQGAPKIVQESLIGGVLSNLLLISGLSLFAGGIRNRVQTYSTLYSSTLLVALLLMGVIVSLTTCLPEQLFTDAAGHADTATIAHAVETHVDPALNISRIVSVIALAYYCCFLLFSLKTHRDLFEDEDGDDDEEDVLGLWGAVFWLACLTATISVVCEGLVDAIEGAARATSMSELFITSVILPNVNNAPEHAVAIRLGYNNKPDAVMAIAVGSAAQLGLFLLPAGVMMDWVRGGDFDLRLETVEAVGFVLAIAFASIALSTGKSTWIIGLSLILVYCAIAASWFYAPATYLATIRVPNANLSDPSPTYSVDTSHVVVSQALHGRFNVTTTRSIMSHVGAAAVAHGHALIAAPM